VVTGACGEAWVYENEEPKYLGDQVERVLREMTKKCRADKEAAKAWIEKKNISPRTAERVLMCIPVYVDRY